MSGLDSEVCCWIRGLDDWIGKSYNILIYIFYKIIFFFNVICEGDLVGKIIDSLYTSINLDIYREVAAKSGQVKNLKNIIYYC